MRYCQPLTPDENAIDLALRKQHRSHADQDRALSEYRLAVRFRKDRPQRLERVADLLLGEASP